MHIFNVFKHYSATWNKMKNQAILNFGAIGENQFKNNTYTNKKNEQDKDKTFY